MLLLIGSFVFVGLKESHRKGLTGCERAVTVIFVLNDQNATNFSS